MNELVQVGPTWASRQKRKAALRVKRERQLVNPSYAAGTGGVLSLLRSG